MQRPEKLSHETLSALLSDIGLNIRETRVFSTTDGYSLDVFVVDGWPIEETDGLHKAIEASVLRNEGSWSGSVPSASKRSLPFLAQDFKILGLTSCDRGKLVCAGGHNTSDGCQRTPIKYRTRRRGHRTGTPINNSGNNGASFVETTESMKQFIDKGNREINERKRQKTDREIDDEQLDRVQAILEEDEINESDDLYVQTKEVCIDRVRRKNYLTCKTKEGRIKYVKFVFRK